MANKDNPTGLTPARFINGSPYNGAAVRCYVPSSDSTAIYPGGLVKLAGSSDSRGVPSVTGNVSTGDGVFGVVVSVEPVTEDSLLYRAASTERYLNVCMAEGVLFRVQDDASATLAATSMGQVADLTGFTSGDTIYGKSAIEISATSATASGDGTEDVVILGLADTPDNEIGDNAEWLVRLNNLQLVDGFTGV